MQVARPKPTPDRYDTHLPQSLRTCLNGRNVRGPNVVSSITGEGGLADAGPVGALRPVRGLPAPARGSRPGRRARPPARPAGHRGTRGAHGGVAHGAAGLAAPVTAVHRA